MPHIVLLRHAQASFFGATYDALSELGTRQAQALGRHWASSAIEFDRVYVGPLQRHLQTLERIEQAYRESGRYLPRAESLDLLDEHHGVRVVSHALGRSEESSQAMQTETSSEPAEQERLRREYFQRFREILLRWSAADIDVPGSEPFAAFRDRSSRVLARLQSGGSGRVLAITSGGLASMVAGCVLGLSNEHVIDLNLVLRNCATTEFLCSRSRQSLLCFNALPAAVRDIGETFI